MFDDFLNKAAELLAKGEPFATASVVRFQPPISGKPGDKAIIFGDGKMWGWIGGGCAQPAVIKEALRALADGQPRLVRISPNASSEEGIIDYAMSCHSGGTLDIYIEPVLPKPHIVILGRSPVAQTLALVGKTIGYRVSAVAPGADHEQFPNVDRLQTELNLDGLKVTRDTFIVVSTQGENDEEALEQAVKTDAGYIAFVASKVKAEKVCDYLRQAGVAAERVGQIRAPAGINLHATLPEEIAVSVLAEIIQMKGNRARPSADLKKSSRRKVLPVLSASKPDQLSPNDDARDPVCGMTVNTAIARHKSEHRGSVFYFCCGRCKQAFDLQPEKYSLLISS